MTQEALVVAVGVNEDGIREVLGCDVGPTESYAFWERFLKGLVERGLKGVRLVISDAHTGLKEAIGSVLHGASWQRCRVHFMRNVLSLVPKHAQGMVSASVKTIFAQANQEDAKETLRKVAETLGKRFPRVAGLLYEAEEEVLTYMSFPREHWRQIHSTNPLERLMREIKRRSDVVGIFPNPQSLLRLATAILEEVHEEWMVGRRYFSQASMALVTGKGEERVVALDLGGPPVAA